MARKPSAPLPSKLKLSDAVWLLVEYFESTDDYARDLLEREIYGGGLQKIAIHYPDGSEWPTDIAAWRKIDWKSGCVTMEPSWAGSPAQYLPVIPLLDREEIVAHFAMVPDKSKPKGRRAGGRPTQHDWDGFWIEVCRRLAEDGLPETQRALTDAMLDWFMARGDETIDERTVEKKISKLFASLRPE